MIKIGLMIGGRYEVLEKIGTGGMSDVYKAMDHKLNRLVAVKVLKQEFAENENFVSKFVVEAQAAAGLMHSCIVNVYDVGDENGIHYIVMELVDGITLKKYIEKKVRLSVKESVSIAIQVAMGLEAAHNNHIIHRDIKPQNIIISKEGRVKVTDFGIAKAATSNTITSNVMGSVHYTSPEQARGGYSDAKSDIYSLGITLFEMLTGRLPFNGDTTVAIAIKHIQEDLPSPKQFNSEIPISVEKIVLKCCQKSPDRRYQTASELIVDLKRSLITPDEDFVSLPGSDEEGVTRMMTETDREKPSVVSESGTMRLREDIPARQEDRQRRVRRKREKPLEDDLDDFDSDERRYGAGMEKLAVAAAILAAIIVGTIVVVLVGRSMGLFGGEDPSDSIMADLGSSLPGNSASTGFSMTVDKGVSGIVVPDVVGYTYAEAVAALREKGFEVEKVTDDSGSAPEDEVIETAPSAGESAVPGAQIKVKVSLGRAGDKAEADAETSETEDESAKKDEENDNLSVVPNVVGFETDAAMATLAEAGLVMGTVIDANNDTFAEGLITAQSKEVGTVVERGTTVNLERSLGPINQTYMYSGDITAPTEGDGYSPDLEVHVTLITADGTSLLDTTTASFPITGVVRTGLISSTGTLTFEYTAAGPTTTDENGNIISGDIQNYQVRRAIAFVQE